MFFGVGADGLDLLAAARRLLADRDTEGR